MSGAPAASCSSCGAPRDGLVCPRPDCAYVHCPYCPDGGGGPMHPDRRPCRHFTGGWGYDIPSMGGRLDFVVPADRPDAHPPDVMAEAVARIGDAVLVEATFSGGWIGDGTFWELFARDPAEFARRFRRLIAGRDPFEDEDGPRRRSRRDDQLRLWPDEGRRRAWGA